MVVLTGDYVTHDYRGRFRKKVVKLLSQVQSRLGVYASLGNHDYGIGGAGALRRSAGDGLEAMVQDMELAGIKVLRNSAACLELDGQCLWFVGLGDLWAGDFEPYRAFEQVECDGVVIALSHNPETVGRLEFFGVDAVMCGHTHGSGVEWTALPDRPLVNRRRYYSGMYDLGDTTLYVNRGLGRHGRLFNRRPEIAVFTLA